MSVHATLDDGRRIGAGVLSGASTGSREAVELRDGDGRYEGLACDELCSPADELTGRPFTFLEQTD